jgi:hypothetical protein
MKKPYVHEDVRECNDASKDVLNDILASCNAEIDKDGELIFADDVDTEQVMAIGKLIWQSDRSHTLQVYRAAGYWWIKVSTGKYGSRKELLIKMFGIDSWEKMYAYYSTKASVCRAWHLLWNENMPWEYHKLERPEGFERRKYEWSDEPKEEHPAYSTVQAIDLNSNEVIPLQFHIRDGLKLRILHPETDEVTYVSIMASQFADPVGKTIKYNKLQELNSLYRSGRIKLPPKTTRTKSSR